MWWSTSSGKIELNITKKIANSCMHQGRCNDDVKAAMKLPEIKRQLNKLNPEILKEELREYGAWDESELNNHADNLMRILWIASGDILENEHLKNKHNEK